jgi:PTS system nitrogen regulatory IIA component
LSSRIHEQTMYLNLIQIAESFGVTEKVVEGWIREEGLPHTLDRGRLLFDRAQVAQWAAKRGLASQVGFLAPETSAFATGVRLEALLRAGGILRDVQAAEVPAVFERVAAALPGATPSVRQLVAQRLRAPGGVTIAPVGRAFALPHPSSRIALGRDSGTLALVLLRDALPLSEPPADGVPVTRLFFFIAPSPRAHLDLLGRLGRLLTRGPLRSLVDAGAPDDEILQAVEAFDRAPAGGPDAEMAS